MDNTSTLIEILKLAREIGNIEIAEQAITEIAAKYEMVVIHSSIKRIVISTPLSMDNRIPAIKELREKGNNLGLHFRLQDAKEEIDRRVALLPPNQW